MDPVLVLITGMIVGIMMISPVVFLMSLRSEFTEIHWHDARRECPCEYVEQNPILGRCIRVLVRYDNGRVHFTHWLIRDDDRAGYPDIPGPCYATHFAYVYEIEHAIYFRKH